VSVELSRFALRIASSASSAAIRWPRGRSAACAAARSSGGMACQSIDGSIDASGSG